MRKKCSATPNTAVMPGPARRWTGLSSPRSMARKPARRGSGSIHAMPHMTADATEIDAGLYLFALCRHLQMTCLDRRGIDCRVDAKDAGRLPASVCRMLGLVVTELVQDASECSRPQTMRRTVTVTLHRRGATCLCTVACQGLKQACPDAPAGLQRVRHLAEELPGDCRVRPMPERGLVAVMFDARLVERDFPAAFWRYRAGEAWRSPRQHYPMMLE